MGNKQTLVQKSSSKIGCSSSSSSPSSNGREWDMRGPPPKIQGPYTPCSAEYLCQCGRGNIHFHFGKEYPLRRHQIHGP